MIDYRALLLKYMAAIVEYESIDFVDRIDCSEEDKLELEKLSNEIFRG